MIWKNLNKQIQISGHIIGLHKYSPLSWEWTKNYLSLNGNYQFVLEIPSFLALPLAASIVAKLTFGSSQDTLYYPTWKLTSTNLHAVFNSLWESLEPETENIIGNVELLPMITAIIKHYLLKTFQNVLFPNKNLLAQTKFLVFSFVERRWNLPKCETVWKAIYSMPFIILKTQKHVVWDL